MLKLKKLTLHSDVVLSSGNIKIKIFGQMRRGAERESEKIIFILVFSTISIKEKLSRYFTSNNGNIIKRKYISSERYIDKE